MYLLNGPQVALQGVPGHLGRRLENLILPLELHHHVLGGKVLLLGTMPQKVPQGDFTQPHLPDQLFPLLIRAPQGEVAARMLLMEVDE